MEPTTQEDLDDDQLQDSSSSTAFRLLLSEYSFPGSSLSHKGVVINGQPNAAGPSSSRRSVSSTSPRKRINDGPAADSPSKKANKGRKSSTPSPKKKKVWSYAPPETYAHLQVLTDCVKLNLDSGSGGGSLEA